MGASIGKCLTRRQITDIIPDRENLLYWADAIADFEEELKRQDQEKLKQKNKKKAEKLKKVLRNL